MIHIQMAVFSIIMLVSGKVMESFWIYNDLVGIWVRPWSFRPKNLEGSERKTLQNFSPCSPQASQPQCGNKCHEMPHLLLLSSSKLPQYQCLDRFLGITQHFLYVLSNPMLQQAAYGSKNITHQKKVAIREITLRYIPSGKLTWQWENGTFWRCISLLKTRWFSSQPF